jgi:hypothetical protein
VWTLTFSLIQARTCSKLNKAVFLIVEESVSVEFVRIHQGRWAFPSNDYRAAITRICLFTICRPHLQKQPIALFMRAGVALAPKLQVVI